MTLGAYLISFPERLVRSALGLAAGVAREVGEVAVPVRLRRSHLYQNLVEATLRYLIEEVGGVENVYSVEGTLPEKFLARRMVGNGVELLGIVAFRASPVWILAALADLCGIGRQLIPQIADALKAQGLLEEDAEFTTVDQMLDGLERTSSRLATTINTPPLDVRGLRQEWNAIREEARSLPFARLPSRDAIVSLWSELKTESARQNRSIFETSSVMAVSAARALPNGVRWLSATARVGASRAGHLVAAGLLDHYRQTLAEIHRVGYVTYVGRQLRPYVRAAAGQFSPKRRTLTQDILEKFQSMRTEPMPAECLFSYGTLQLEAVQMATFGHKLTGTRDVLPGFEEARVEIEDPTTVSLSGKTHHAIAKFTGRPSDAIDGTVYALTAEEIQSADKYEVAAYKRVAVILRSGVRAWVYVDALHPPPVL
jgi:hypothetical protein